MTNQEHISILITDIRDCARRAREMSDDKHAAELLTVAREIEESARRVESERPSLPPALAENQEVRSAANKHFQNARSILKGIR